MELTLTQEQFKQLCALLDDAMEASDGVPCSADPATWRVFSDGAVSLTLNGKTLADVEFRLSDY